MRVGLDVSAVPARPAGAGRYIVELATRLAGTPTELTLLTRRGDADRWRRFNHTARVESNVPNSRLGRLAYESLRLARSQVVASVDLWHSPHYTMPHGAKLPVVVTIHDMTFFTHPEWHERTKVEFFRRAVRYAATHAAALVTVSEFTARELREICPSDRPVYVAPLGVDLERFTPHESGSEPTGSGDATTRYVLFLGTLEPRKGLDTLLQAFDEVAEHDHEIELWIVGQAGWDAAGVARIGRTLRHAGRVRRLGYVADELLPGVLRDARVVAYPSRGEGFGLPVLEALACGVPVVTSSNTVMAEVAGDAATLTPAGDVGALAGALSGLLALSETERAEFARAGRARAEMFTWQRCVAQHLEAYETVLSNL